MTPIPAAMIREWIQRLNDIIEGAEKIKVLPPNHSPWLSAFNLAKDAKIIRSQLLVYVVGDVPVEMPTGGYS